MKIKKAHIISFIAGALAMLILVSVIYVFSVSKSYINRILSLGSVTIDYIQNDKYNRVSESSLSIDMIFYLSAKEKMYFGKVSEDEYIDIYQRNIANIRIYPHTEESVILEYDPIGFGFTERYVLGDQGFKYYMQEIYRFTGNESFNIYPED